jgi:hypothetical protein
VKLRQIGHKGLGGSGSACHHLSTNLGEAGVPNIEGAGVGAHPLEEGVSLAECALEFGLLLVGSRPELNRSLIEEGSASARTALDYLKVLGDERDHPKRSNQLGDAPQALAVEENLPPAAAGDLQLEK